MTGDDAAYRRGQLDGEIRERLDSHDRQLTSINGQLGQVVNELHEMTKAVQRVSDKQQAVIDTTAATRDAMREQSEHSWTRVQKLLAVVGGVVGVVSVILALYIAFHKH